MHPSLPSALSCALVLAVAACQPAAPPPAAPVQDGAAVAPVPPAPAPQWRVADWPLPAAGAAAQPDLIAAPDGGWLLSWIEPGERGGHALKFARAGRDGAWGATRTIAQGRDWFVNWADTPHIALAADGALWAHWLRKSAPATYAYDVALSRSADGGASWSDPIEVNDDGTATEHGFVSLWPDGADGIGVAWLDGRRTGGGEGHDAAGHAGHRGAMTLRAARFDARLRRSLDTELDPMTCDCCQTDAAPTARGPLLVYRDRDAQDIRDIAATRREAGGWTAPRHVYADRWTMPACPVNGPSVAAQGEDAIVAWYTAAGGESKVQVARSRDAGASFGAPVVLDRGEPVQGRVEAALGADAAWVLWLREDRQEGQTLWLARLAPDLSRELQRLRVARLQGRGRGTGFAQLAVGDGAVYVVWTELAGGAARLRGARLQLEATVSSNGESNIDAGETTGSSSGTRAP